MAARTAILDSLDDLVTPDLLSRVSSFLGESQGGISKAMGAAFPVVLGGMLAKANSTSATNDLFGLVTDRANDGSVLNNTSSLVGSGATSSPLSGLSSRLLSSVFGSNQSVVNNALSNFAGIKSSSASTIMSMAAPLVLGFLGKEVRQRELSAGGFMNMLLAQKDRILAALPGPLSGVMNMGTDVPHVGRVTTGPAQSSRRWLWTALTLLAALFAIWLFSRRPEVAQTTQRTADAIQEGVGTAVSGLGAFVSRALPDGVRLNVPESGMESRLLAFLGNPALPVDDTTWFDFDRINFATGSATLTPDSREQLSNLAAILNAYPSVRFKVGGYTDNTGDPAANMKLSTDRANSVRNDLMALGVSADRMTAEGYGDQHPIADNSTEEGRARNRRISIRLLER